MKFSFQNLGPIAKGEITLGDLTIICGPNNSGKTMISYALYEVLKNLKTKIEIDIRPEIERLFSQGIIVFDLEPYLKDWAGILKKAMENFPLRSQFFENASFDLFFQLTERWIQNELEDNYIGMSGETIFSLNKPAFEAIVSLTIGSRVIQAIVQDNNPRQIHEQLVESWNEYTTRKIVHFLIDNTIAKPYIMTAERTGVAAYFPLFGSMGRIAEAQNPVFMNSVAEVIAIDNNTVESLSFIQTDALLDSLEFAIKAKNNSIIKGDFFKKHEKLVNILKNISGGEYVLDDDGVYFYDKTAKQKINLVKTSSTIKSLFSLDYWLNHEAKIGDLLMIDEPELNLHPHNQRLFARFLVELVNAGIKVWITTHSDTIIREMNTLILLSKNTDNASTVRQKFGYGDHEKLEPQQVRLYVTEAKGKSGKVQLRPVKINAEEGIEVESFDQTVSEINRMQDLLRFGA